MISVTKVLYEFNPALAQAGIWGLSSALASKATDDPVKSKEERKKNLKKAGVSGLIGAAAGALGTMV